MNHRKILFLFIERLDQVSRLDYSSLRAAQPRPHASIACGAAGIAVALVRASIRLRLPDLRSAAVRWAVAASEARREDFINREAGMRNVAGSLWFGPNGARAVFGVLAEPLDFGPPTGLRKHDVIHGRAGWLPFLLLLERHGIDPTHADRVAHSLLRSLAYATGGVGFAHGRLGIQHALLGWAKRRAYALPAAFWAALATSTVLDPRLKSDGALARSWCNGSAGLLLTEVDPIVWATGGPS